MSCARRAMSSPGDKGATAVEYAIMVGFIASVIVAGVTVLGQVVLGLFQSAGSF